MKVKKLLACVAALVALTACTGIAWRFSPLAGVLNSGKLTMTLSSVQNSPWAPYLFIAAYPIGGLIVFPVMLMGGIVAALFPPLQAMAISFTGILLSAALLHRIGAYFRNHVQSMLGSATQRIDNLLANQGITTVAAIRMVPLAPFTVVNLVAGALGVSFRDYMLGTALGLTPGMVMICLFGHQARQVWRHPTPASIATGAAILVGWLTLSITLQRWAKRHHNKESIGSSPSSSPQKALE